MSECAKNGAVRTASSTPNGVAPPQPQELSDLFSPIQSSSKNLDAAIQSNSVKVNDEANSNQLFTPQNFENCVRQAVTLILSTFIPNLAVSQGQPKHRAETSFQCRKFKRSATTNIIIKFSLVESSTPKSVFYSW